MIGSLIARGEDVQALAVEKINRSKGRSEISFEMAMDEVIADASEMMLENSEAMRELATRDKGVVERIREFIEKFISKMREAFSGVEALHREAVALREQDKDGVMRYVDGLEEKFDRMLRDATGEGLRESGEERTRKAPAEEKNEKKF